MNVAEIFSSIHGEVNGHHQGRLVTFIRLSGCNLKCSYCDTKETQNSDYGTPMSIHDILRKVQEFGNDCICLTGGEPLYHDDVIKELLKILWLSGYAISVETNGTTDITPFFRYVESFVIDFKLDFVDKMIHNNFIKLRKTDIIKFVISDEEQLAQALYWKAEFEHMETDALFAFSPVHSIMSAEELTNTLIKQQENNCIISMQIHKILNLK